MTAPFSLKGLFGEASISVEIESSRILSEMHDALTGPPRNLTDAQATRVVEDVALVGLTRMARSFERIKSKHIDLVLKLRSEIDGLFVEAFASEGAGSKETISKALDERLPRIKQAYAQLDTAVEKATEPLARMKAKGELDDAMLKAVDDVAPNKPLVEDRPIEADKAIEAGKTVNRLTRKKIYPFGSGFKVTFKDGAETVLSIVNGRYTAEIYPGKAGVGKPRVISEFSLSIDPYRTDFRTTSILQRNHVVQDSLMKKLFGPFGYDSGSVPTIWMRDSRTGSPHHQVSAQQRAFKTAEGSTIVQAERRSTQLAGKVATPLPPNKLNLGELQKMGIAQMKSQGCPPQVIAEYLKVFDEVFTQQVLGNAEFKKLSPADQASLLGDWKPGRGIAKP